MSAVSPTGRPLTPEELDELFNRVWDGYTAEQRSSLVQDYSQQNGNLPSSMDPPPPPQSYTPERTQRPPSTTPSTSSPRARRPLPPTPGPSRPASGITYTTRPPHVTVLRRSESYNPHQTASFIHGPQPFVRDSPPITFIHDLQSTSSLVQVTQQTPTDEEVETPGSIDEAPPTPGPDPVAAPRDSDASSLYPDEDTPCLPVYTRNEAPNDDVMPPPNYDYPPAPNGDIYHFSPANVDPGRRRSFTSQIDYPQSERPETPSAQPTHTPGDFEFYSQHTLQSTSELSYVSENLPHARFPDPVEEIRRSVASDSPMLDPIALPSSIGILRSDSVQLATQSYLNSSSDRYLGLEANFNDNAQAGPSNLHRRPTDYLRDIGWGGAGRLGLHDELEDDFWPAEDLDEPDRFVNFALLSHLAVQFRDKVPRGTHVKSSIPYTRAFTGKDIVSTIQSQISRELVENHSGTANDRRAALQVARSLQSQLMFYEVEWGGRILQDGVEDVYMFLDDQEGTTNDAPREALPTSVVTILATCYSPSCGEGPVCYAYGCPRKGDSLKKLLSNEPEAPVGYTREAWPPKNVQIEVLKSLPESEINRQIIIHKLISKEEQYVSDLDLVDSVFIQPLRKANPPVITPSDRLDDFIESVFNNILDVRECNRRLLENLDVRQREQSPLIGGIGDILLGIAADFRDIYPAYIGNHPLAERRMKDELEDNPDFRLFIEKCSRQQSARPGASTGMRLDLRHFLNRPSEHLQKYPVLLQAICKTTARGNPDSDFLIEAIAVIKNLQGVAQLRTFQSAMGRGITGKWGWQDLVTPDARPRFSPDEVKRQTLFFELVKGEMLYAKDLENIHTMYIRALRNSNPPIIPVDRLDRFIKDVFHNFSELRMYHRRLVNTLHQIQRDEHPKIRSITAAVCGAVLDFREAYLEYIPNYPIAAYRIDDELEVNPVFRMFVENCVRHPDAHRTHMKDFLNCPLPRLVNYVQMLRSILDVTPRGHEDLRAIPDLIEMIESLGRETEPGVASAKQKVQLWTYNANLVFRVGEMMDLDLLNESRALIHTGKLLRQPESGSEASGWNDTFVLLFDNYLVMTKRREQDGVVKYHVSRRPIPLDLLSLVKFTDHPVQRGGGSAPPRNHRSAASSASASSNSGGQSENGDSQPLYPFTLHHNGRFGGPIVLHTELSAARVEWRQKLEEAVGLRKVVQESNKVFEMETLSMHTFNVPPVGYSLTPSTWSESNPITGKVTCSIPFNTPDGRRLVAIGCSEGIWIGFRHDSGSMRRVLHLKAVTQCTMLDDFGLFLVLSDKHLFAYHIEALVPTPQHATQLSIQIPNSSSQIPQKLSGSKDVEFFSVGKMMDRTFVIYMRKRGSDSHFHVLEPVLEKIHETPKAPAGMMSFLKTQKQEWFKSFKEFWLASDTYDLIFLKARIAILSRKNGFEIMNLLDTSSTIIPSKSKDHDAVMQRFESSRPIGIFRSHENEFLLCYSEFGIYVDKQGAMSRPPNSIIEWEGTADSVAFHAPYVLLFDPRFIEVRQIETGRLSQIIMGQDVRCVWDGRGYISNHDTTPNAEDEMVQEAHVHAVMIHPETAIQASGRPLRPVAQHVFELIPTIPLYLPGSLSSPSTATYFPRSDSFSPPRSPQLRASTSYLP